MWSATSTACTRCRPASTSTSSSRSRATKRSRACSARRAQTHRIQGVHVLLDALRDVDARAVIVGFGDYRAELERLAPARALFTGPLEHRHLKHLLALADATVVPSIFPEAFGMVAAEAAAAGSPPLVARHSGLSEIADGLEAAYPVQHRELASFKTGDAHELADKLNALLALPQDERRALGQAARSAAVDRWSWRSVATRLLTPLQIR
ncbi:MAG: glycosyltransferase [Actinobacteria bacterium]|nr:MAG: glycosyltransferase [Actinomycetota bacterium]